MWYFAATAEYVCWELLARTIASHRNERSDFTQHEALTRSGIKQTMQDMFGGFEGLCYKLGFSIDGQ